MQHEERHTVKIPSCLAVCTALVLAGTSSMGRDVVITSFQANGHLTWTNPVDSHALYRVEWASQAHGPWYRTFDNIGTLDGLDGSGFTVSVPMFYRIVLTTNQPPAGMVWIDAGEFVMGDTRGTGYGTEVPVHTNFIGGFWMDEMEVRKAKWDEVRNWATNHGYSFAIPEGEGKAFDHPVVNVIWYDCVKWCNARSQMEGLGPCYYTSPALDVLYTNGNLDVHNDWVDWSADGYRLPTEAEWEKAARGGRQGKEFPWGGNTISHQQANYYSSESDGFDASPTHGYHPAYTNGGTPYTSPAGSFPANGYGLHDMAGNAAEWCWDWYNTYPEGNQVDPCGPTSGTRRVLRGSDWFVEGTFARCMARGSTFPDAVGFHTDGFRCVRRP